MVLPLLQVISCDFAVSATGIVPNTEFLRNGTSVGISMDDEGYIVVDEHFRTTASNIFAAGDCCVRRPGCWSSRPSSSGAVDEAPYFQMRLWSQARVMGAYAAQCMTGVQEEYGLDSFFELFAHITRFFGHKVRAHRF